VPAGVAGLVVIVSVDDEEPPGVRLGPMLRETVKSVAVGNPAAARLTDPVSPRLDTVTVDEAELPETILDGLGETAVIVKSGTSVTVTDGLFVREKDPLTPLIVTL
jgi:hypothetical protein